MGVKMRKKHVLAASFICASVFFILTTGIAPAFSAQTAPKSSYAYTDFLQKKILESGRPKTLQVYEGCFKPPTDFAKKIYFDPSKGSLLGDGSAQKPYKDLASFMDSTLKNNLKGNEELVLRRGNHGYVNIQNLLNRDFIQITPYPGESPIIQTMQVSKANKLIFKGLRFTPYAMKEKMNGTIVTVDPSSSNVVFLNNSFFTTYDTAKWTDQDWNNKTYGGLFTRSSCTTVVGNSFFNLHSGYRNGSNQSVMTGNLFKDIVNDSVNFHASHQLIQHNVVLYGRNNSYNYKYHSDGMQGWTNNVATTNRNIVIDGNLVAHYIPLYKDKDKKVRDAFAYRQGISIFDGMWDNVTISNNIVITNAFCAMSYLGLANSRIFNNTLLSSDPENIDAEMMVLDSKEGRRSVNVAVSNNIAHVLRVGKGVDYDHNVIVKDIKVFAGKNTFYTRTKKGYYAGTNLLLAGKAEDIVSNVSGPKKLFDVRLMPNSPAKGAGVLLDYLKTNMFGELLQPAASSTTGKSLSQSINAGAQIE
jgi:hypothetical protein